MYYWILLCLGNSPSQYLTITRRSPRASLPRLVTDMGDDLRKLGVSDLDDDGTFLPLPPMDSIVVMFLGGFPLVTTTRPCSLCFFRNTIQT
jgi:hypothetical protein